MDFTLRIVHLIDMGRIAPQDVSSCYVLIFSRKLINMVES